MPTPEPPVADARSGMPRAGGLRRIVTFVRRSFVLARAALGFAYFGIGVGLVGITVLPFLRRSARWQGLPDEVGIRRAQRFVRLFCRSFVMVASRVVRVIDVKWIGAEAFERGPVLIVANHPSLIDTPLLLTQLAQADFIVSPEWSRLGWLRGVISSADYMRTEDGAMVVREAVARLRAGRSVVVYPEGARTPPEGLRPFQRGAAHIALAAGCDILPVTIRVSPRALMRGNRLADFPLTKPIWHIEVGERMRPEPPRAGEPRTLAARRLTGVLEEHFAKRWERGRS